MHIDTVFVNGRFRTMDPRRPTARSIGVLRERIVAIDDDLRGVSADTVVDLAGAPILPGFNDAHFHLSHTGARLSGIDLRASHVSSLPALYEEVSTRAARLPADAWILGAGYDQTVLGGHPTAEGLDTVAGGRPVMLEHVSGHMLATNTRALELAGYPDRSGVPAIDGGQVTTDATGRATGLLQERAMAVIYDLIKPLELIQVQRNLALAGEQAVRYGLTSVTEPGLGSPSVLGNSPVDIHSYQVAWEENRLLPRVTAMPYCLSLHQLEGFRDKDWFGLDLGIRSGFGDDHLRIGPVKILADGSLLGRTAAMRHCYEGEPDNRGILVFDPDALREMICRAHASGWTVATHAIGDAAIDLALDAVEEAQRRFPRHGVRHRIEHFAVSTPAQVARAARLGVIPVPQGSFASDFGDAMIDAVGPQRSHALYRMKSLLAAGIVLCGSTDSPVSDGNPLRSLHGMVNRITATGQIMGPLERVTVEEAVRAYTYGSAFAAGQEKEKGMLKIGQLADFVATSDDVFSVDPTHIGDVHVGMTVIGGTIAYGDSAQLG